ncbi:DUF2075 domain-containing protein [Lacticaseibacillus zeae]|uniref:DUF2075 domain-containing protein n=1 Tax=Lacticaseibacillus zeae subsp. silagei TaxID=3068307 RepID=A0ABD7Z7F8_LACZE|nr:MULTISPECIES: DUF2075 domain-containing protein [Lacticaseibacillus]MDE3315776.1 DUF2075 domain-containing protein [Lacticaseibacillus zeae]OFR91603.1 ATP-dependent exonuclease [Lactobacillus sp. HMSC068F07]WLV82826.1 DUF2075 domain-containing protein [Lacticaseibacillus sp. NCIMB 15475]WLV85567.1 DUF2075 domain-containing protein [Lacticaseibacillus sp. NCIMB 15474]
MDKVDEPIVRQVPYSRDGLTTLKAEGKDPVIDKFLLQYPTVYVIHTDKKSANQVTVYVGETSDIHRRTIQHLVDDPAKRADWASFSNDRNAQMIVIGHQHFNKSLTMDIENRLMLYLSGVPAVKQLNNRRTNPQNQYYTAREKNNIFVHVWEKLHHINKVVFPVQKVVEDSAMFKASPFHALTDEQLSAKEQIFDHVKSALGSKEVGQLILVEGEAGSGKTVLLSSLFYELATQLDQNGTETDAPVNKLSVYTLVNHEEQLKVYQQIATKLGISSPKDERVMRPTRFINQHLASDTPVDVILVDEAHLLWTQGKQSYRGKNQLMDLLLRARVVIAVFDKHQVLRTNGYWEDQQLQKIEKLAGENIINLKQQMRMQASPRTIAWVDSLVHAHKVLPIPKDRQYEIRIFNSPAELQAAIKNKKSDNENGLSRLLATFDWPYTQKGKDKPKWYVKIGSWRAPWNLELPRTKHRGNKDIPWAEQTESLEEVGSTFTIQGFDLNFAGVIIGPSVKFRQGRIVFDPSKSCDSGATNKRTLSDNSKVSVANELIENELNVLLTRGVHGLYIYAVDPGLRKALLVAQNVDSSARDLPLVAEDRRKYKTDNNN